MNIQAFFAYSRDTAEAASLPVNVWGTGFAAGV